ncbi:MAG TPA: vWA domain-containing protein [Humisphaera sp.]
MTRLLAALLTALLVALPARAADEPKAAPPPAGAADKPHIDLVICFDCSGSMGPVIQTAKQKVWAIVNQTAKAKPTPVLRIGLIGYGNATGPFRFMQLTDDLDEVYKFLNTFDDRLGGDEFVGLAVHRATADMQWHDGKQTLKLIYVVGNETAHQGPAEFDYTKTAPAAIAKGIIVNAIYCGSYDYEKASPTWREMAKLADKRYLEIAETGGVVAIATPFDDDLAKLSTQLNGTYVAYGAAGGAAAANQVAQDANAAGLGKHVAAERAAAKAAPGVYSNGRWDLVDRSKDKDFDVSKLKPEELPEDMRKLAPEQRKAYVDQKAKEREAIQAQVKELAAKRDAYVRAEQEKKGITGDKAFDAAVQGTLKEQAEKKGYKFE